MTEKVSDSNEGLSPEQCDLISAIGNNELKSLTLGLMRVGIPYGQTGLHREIIEVQGEPLVWRPAVYTPTSYCQQSFSRIGMVAKATLDYSGASAYEITSKGSNIGHALVGHLLSVSLEENASLIDLVGPTNTNSKNSVRPSERRIKLLKILADSAGARISSADISSELGLRIGHTGSIFDDLTMSGLISRETVGRGEPKVHYKVLPSFLTASHRADISTPFYKNTIKVIESLYEGRPNQVFSNSEFASELVRQGYELELSTGLIRKVASITNRLSIIRDLLQPQYTGEERVRDLVFITDSQSKTIGNFLMVVAGLESISDEFLGEGKEKLTVVLRDKDKVRYLLGKARKSSVGLKRTVKGQDDMFLQINNSFVGIKQPLTITEIRSRLGLAGINLDRVTIRKMLESQVSQGTFEKTSSQKGSKYLPLRLSPE